MTETTPARPRGAVLFAALAWTSLACATSEPTRPSATPVSGSYDDLVALFEDWRAFERPPMRDGAPDYSARRMAAAHARAAGLLRPPPRPPRPDSWSIAQQVDWHLVRAELNGFDFNCRVLKPGSATRPSTSRSGRIRATPRARGPDEPRAARAVDLRPSPSPTREEARSSRAELAVIPPLLAQARGNLTGNARDLASRASRTCATRSRASRRLASKLASGRTRTRADRGARGSCARRRVEMVAWARGRGALEQDRPVGRRQGELHLVPAERAPRAPDMGGRGAAAGARAGTAPGRR